MRTLDYLYLRRLAGRAKHIGTRRATAEDLDTVAAFQALEVCEEAGVDVSPDIMRRVIENAESMLSDARYWVMLAIVNGKAAGQVIAQQRTHPVTGATRLWVFGLYVAPRHRGRGIGAALVCRCLEAGLALLAESVEFNALSENAARLHRRLGARPISTDYEVRL